MPNTKTPNIPGATVMTDTLDFVKNLWGSMGVPGMSIPGLTAPTLTVEDLDKKIGDLKAVEAWLNVNMSMLRATIQGLEVQRGTLVTLKSLGASFAAAVKQPEKLDPQLRDSPYASAFFSHANTPAPAASPATPAEPAEPAKAAEPASAAGSDAAAAMGNPALWWNVLQEQFKQAVSSAMSPEAVASATAMATDAAARFAASVTPEPAAEPGVARAAPSDKPSNKGGDADQAGGAGTAKPRAARSAKG
jgi:hypothetical protein